MLALVSMKMEAFKKSFFDDSKIRRAKDKGRMLALRQSGFIVRDAARALVRRRKRISRPGEPPSAHAKTKPNMRTILFGHDPQRDSVVVGPVKLNQVVRSRFQPRGTVPQVLEEGGVVDVVTRDGRREEARIAPRPYMGPALRNSQPKIKNTFRNSIRS